MDTFWQTETGGHTITCLPGCTPMKPGSASFPFFGIKPVILDENRKPVEVDQEGYLVRFCSSLIEIQPLLPVF